MQNTICCPTQSFLGMIWAIVPASDWKKDLAYGHTCTGSLMFSKCSYHSILQPISQNMVIIDHSDKTIQLYSKDFKDSSFTVVGTL